MYYVLTAIVLAVCGNPALTLPVHAIPVKGAPDRLLVHQDRLFVSSFRGEDLSVFDTKTRQRLHQKFFDAYEIPPDPKTGTPRGVDRCRPGDLIVANDKVFVSQIFSDHIVVFDLKTMWVVKRLRLGGSGYFARAADGKTVYFASTEKDKFYIIDTETYKIRAVAYPPGGSGVGSVARGPIGQRLYLGIQRGGKAPDGVERSGSNCFLAVYDLTKNAYIGTTYLAQTTQSNDSDDSAPYSMAFSPDGRLLYLGMFQSLAGIQVVDTTTLKRVENIPFKASTGNTYFKWADPLGLAVYRRWLMSANRHNNELMVVDRDSAKAVARLSFAGAGQALSTITVQGDRIYFGGEGARAVYELDGRRLVRLVNRALRDGKVQTPIPITLTVK